MPFVIRFGTMPPAGTECALPGRRSGCIRQFRCRSHRPCGLPSVVYTLLVWEASGCCNQRRSCYSGRKYMEGEAIVFHLVWKGRIASREVYHDPFQRRETWSSLIDDTHGFSLIDNENQNEFIDSFHKFEELDWNAIATDNGLDYKTYNKIKKSKRYFSDNGRKALKNSESLSGTDVLVMWIMIFFMCWGLIWTMSWVMWNNVL